MDALIKERERSYMKKRIISFLMALLLVGGVLSAFPAQAAEYSEEEISKKILKVKELFDISDDYSEFSQDIWNYGDGSRWSLNWYTANYDRSLYISVDDNDHIISYSAYDSTEADSSSIPEKLSEYYEEKAQGFIKKYAPEIYGHIALYDTSINYYDNAYTFSYRRMENGYLMPDNTVNVTIDYDTCNVRQFYTQWNYDLEIVKPEKIITKEEAATKLTNKLKMELRYITQYNNSENGVFLAFVPSEKYLSVDAKSGKVYTEKEYYSTDAYATEESMTDERVKGGNGQLEGTATLSEAEIAKIKELATLISKEEAIAVITSNKNLLVDENLSYTNAYLSSYTDGYFWNITMSDPRPIDYSKDNDYYHYYRAYLNARVDAKDGRLVNFYASVPDYFNYDEASLVEFKYSKKQSIKKFEEFVKELEPEKFASTKKTSDVGGYTIYWDNDKDCPVYGGRLLTYTRFVNDIPYYDNGITGSVDRVTGKVYTYSCNWTDDIEFPSAKEAISEKEAYDKYLESDEFELIYEIVSNTVMDEETYISSTENKSRLCYVTNINAAYVDAITGKFLNYNGEEYKPISRNSEFTDIAGHKYEKEIRYVAQIMSKIGGDKFEPDKYATNKFVSDIFTDMWYFYQMPSVKSNDKNIKRQELAKIIIEALGYKKISELDVYRLDFSDADKVSKKYRGAIALCSAFGIFDTKAGSKFNPKSKVTRGEVAAVIARALASNKGR